MLHAELKRPRESERSGGGGGGGEGKTSKTSLCVLMLRVGGGREEVVRGVEVGDGGLRIVDGRLLLHVDHDLSSLHAIGSLARLRASDMSAWSPKQREHMKRN